jgi:glutathione S-transferase
MTGSSFVVFGHRDSGHSYKVCLFLTLARLPYRYVPVDVFKPLAERGAAFCAMSRFGEVPVLVHDDVHISQSNAILLYLSSLTGQFAGNGARGRAAVNEWLFWEMSRLNLGVANLRFALRFEPRTPPDTIALYRKRSEDALERLQREVAQSRFVAGDALSIADLSCCGYLFWAHEAGLDLARYPAVARWLGEIAAQDGWRAPEDLLG